MLVESSIQYIKGVKEGENIFADAKLTHKGKKIGRIDIDVSSENGDVIALMHMIFYMKGDEHRTKTAKDL